MTAMFYSLLLVSIFFISCRADEAVIQAPFDKSGSQAPFDDAATEASFDELENAETKLDAPSDRSTTTVEDQLDKLQILLGILQNSLILSPNLGRLLHILKEVAEDLTEIQPARVYKDCKAAYDAGYTTSGVYTIKPGSVNEVAVYCEQEMDGGGWTVFQRRTNGPCNFYRGWDEYKHGFGSAAGEYWLGNDLLYNLTSNQNTQLLVELHYRNETEYAKYTNFSVQDEGNKYRLHVAGYSSGSPPGDSMTVEQNGYPFSTYDRDNDVWDLSCAKLYSGAWWYSICGTSNLNGRYNKGDRRGVIWFSWTRFLSLTGSRMMVKTK